MKTISSWIYALVAYLAGFAALLAFVGFSVGVPSPLTVDSGAATAPVLALAVDLALVALFGVQHSVMARRGFKAWLTRLVPAHLERSTYLLATSLALAVLMAFWQPLRGQIWKVEDGVPAGILTGLAFAGWGLVLLTTFLISHADLFGLRQVWLASRGVPYTPVGFGTPWLYRHVRHPMQLGVLVGIWVTPAMTAGHLLLATALTGYVVVGLLYEERDLVRQFGERYRTYQRTTPWLIPFVRTGTARVPKPLVDPTIPVRTEP